MLTDIAITHAKPDPARELRLNDGEGLHLAILPDGKKFWRWDYSFQGRRKQLSFGKYPPKPGAPGVTLKEARTKKAAAQRLLLKGTDPSTARKREKVAAQEDTFQAVAEEWLAKETPTLSPKTLEKKRGQLERYLYPALGRLTISQIKVPDVLPILKGIERFSKHETAHRIRQMASQIFRYAVITERAESDPAGLLSDALTPVETDHHPALIDPVEVGTLLTAIERADGSPFVVAALQLSPLVFLRPGELRQAQWKEVDLDRGMLTIPWRRMKPTKARKKYKLDHLVPLSRQAVAILRALKPVAGPDQPLVFPGDNPKLPFSNATLAKVLKRLGYSSAQQTPHGFRTLASTHLREIGFDGELVELQLSHEIANPVRAAYDKAARVPERIRMMQAYADHLDAMKAGQVKTFDPTNTVEITGVFAGMGDDDDEVVLETVAWETRTSPI